MTDSPALQRLLHHYQSMPPVASMQLDIAGYDGTSLRLHAPLAQHVNDKGCAFGGSLVSMMTLGPGGLGPRDVGGAGLGAGGFVADSQPHYLAPLFADLVVVAELAPRSDWDEFASTLRQRGRARASLVARALLPDGSSATQFSARFVAVAKTPAPPG